MLAIITLAVISVLFLVALARPVWAFALVIAMFPIEQCLQGNFPIFIRYSSLANFAVAAVAIVAAFRLFLGNDLVLRRYVTLISVAAALLYSYAALSLLWTFSPEWLAEFIRDALPFVLVIVFFAPLLISRLESLTELRTALMIMGTIVSILLIVNPNFELRSGRFVQALDASTYSNPLAIGTLGGLLVLAATLWPPGVSRPAIIVLRCASFVAGLGLAFLSGSRGQVVGAVVLAVLFYPLSRKLKSWGNFLALVCGLVVVGVGVLAVRSFFVGYENEARWSAESLFFGGSGRVENVMDLADQYFRHPAYWGIGLGCLAFHDLPTGGGDPYSHVLLADLIFELGIPGIVLGGIVLIGATVYGVRLFRMVSDDPRRRADAGFLLAMFAYEFMLANKAGQLWGQTGLFLAACLITRLWYLERDRAFAAAHQSALVTSEAEFEDEGFDASESEPIWT